MFSKPMPNEPPIVGKAMTKTSGRFIIDRIPNGEYYALVRAIKGAANPTPIWPEVQTEKNFQTNER
jgi:hypothetical protein